MALLAMFKIEAAGACPAASDIERQLAPLLPADLESSGGDVARIDEEPDAILTISLVRSDGSLIMRRRLPRAPSCLDQSQTVAVTLAAWEARIHPEISLRLERLSAAPPSADPLLVRNSPGPRPSPAAGSIRLGLGAAVGGGWQAGSVAPGARLELTLNPRNQTESSWRARLAFAGLGNHSTATPPGRATWWRAYAVLGGDRVARLGRGWAWLCGLGVALGQSSIAGSGFTVDRSTQSFDLGGEASLRIQRRIGPVTPWLGVALAAWLRPQSVEVIGAGSPSRLPALEPMVALGADLGRLP